MSIGAIGRAALQAVEIGRRIVADAATDPYEIVRSTDTPDGAGGSEASESVVESGAAILVAGALRPEERAVADRTQAVTPYVVRAMPHNSIVTEQDVIRINARRFEVIGVLRPESLRAAVTAICEERL